MITVASHIARLASPRYRRWRQLLKGLQLDPDELTRPVEMPGPYDFIICGIPRSGTSLLAAALHQPPSVITVLEPWDGLRLPPKELFESFRREVDDTKRLTRGRLNVERLIRDGEVLWGRDGEFPHDARVRREYLLGIKWPSFWRYLDVLPSTKFLVCIRDPVSTVRSFAQQPGSLHRGLDYDVAFNRRMNQELSSATRDDAVRRMLLYEYVANKLLPHLDRQNVFLVRYERWASDSASMLRDISEFLGVDVTATRVVIDETRGQSKAHPEELRLIWDHCPSARALGYTTPVRHEVAREVT